MFGMSGTEIAIILVLALLLLGPQKLPEVARGLGKGLRDFRRATDDIRSTVETEFLKMDDLPPSRPVDPQAPVQPSMQAHVIVPPKRGGAPTPSAPALPPADTIPLGSAPALGSPPLDALDAAPLGSPPAGEINQLVAGNPGPFPIGSAAPAQPLSVPSPEGEDTPR